MRRSREIQEINNSIKESSPLANFWKSEQKERDNKIRIVLVDLETPFTDSLKLFVEEPYKWEILYQSIIRELSKGDKDVIYALKKLLIVLKKDVREETLDLLSNSFILEKSIVIRLKNELRDSENNCLINKEKSLFNPVRFISILIAIFTNPYGIEIKKENKQKTLYEYTGGLAKQFKL